MQQDKFALSVDGMGVQTLEHGEQELRRLRKLKVEKMGELMHAARERLQRKFRYEDIFASTFPTDSSVLMMQTEGLSIFT